jgi:fructose-1-phosphate kinase PfkB-like protein
VEYVVLAGSLPPGVDEGLYAEMVHMAREEGVKVVINAAGEPLTRAMAAGPYLVKPDIRERREVRGMKIESREQMISLCREALSDGAEVVLLSHEITGDILITAEEVWDFIAEDVKFKNIVGAEEALIGGIVYKLAEGAPIEEATRFGMAAAIVAAESPRTVEVDPARIEQGRERVRVVRLE